MIAVVSLAVVGIVLANAASSPRAAPAASVVSAQGTAWGPVDAKVKVIEYGNYGCPHCRDFALSQEQQLRDDYSAGGQVRFEFMPYQLGDPAADLAAGAAVCAADQGQFWAYHDLLFQQSGRSANPFSANALKQYGLQVGVPDQGRFNSCVDSGSHLPDVYRSSRSGQQQGVTGTPTFFVNGEKVEGAVPYAQLKAVIESKLQ